MPCDSPLTVQLKRPFVNPDLYVQDWVPVPCGKCGVCRKNKVDEWSFRLRQQMKVAHSAHFVTLTYDPNFVPMTKNGFMTLARDDITKYFKRLRKWMSDDKVDMPAFKFYLVGEYGETFSRPHYHGIFFNATIDHIQEAWCYINKDIPRSEVTQLLGITHFGNVTSDSIAYCVKYLDKGRQVPKHARDDRVKEFSRMSRGLGQNYLTPEMIAWHRADPSRNYAWNGKYKIALPKFYRDQIYKGMHTKELMYHSAIDSRNKNDYISRVEYFKDYPKHTESDYLLHLEHQKQARYKKYTHGKKRKF